MTSGHQSQLREPPLQFVVHGIPVQQGSKRYVPTAAGPRGKDDNEKRLKPWRKSVSQQAGDAMGDRPLITGPVALRAVFHFPRPANHFGTGRNAGVLKASAPAYMTSTPDLDKLARAIGDALTGIVYRDDKQIVRLIAEKVYGDRAAAVIDVLTIDPA